MRNTPSGVKHIEFSHPAGVLARRETTLPMLSLLKMILAILLLAILVIIGWNNTETVSLMLPLVRNRPFVMPLAVALLYAYLAGLLTFAIVHLFQDLKLRTQISRLRKENRKVSEELHQLRSITLEDLPVSEESGSAGPVVSR